MNDSIRLDEERILSCSWGKSGGSMECDISDIHEDFGQLTQSYTVESMTTDGKLVYGSEFLLFKKGKAVPEDFSRYPKEIKAKIWMLVFAIKERFFKEVQPDVVEHFIKQPYSVQQRFRLYSRWLRPPGYEIHKTAYTIVYTKKTSTDDGGGFFMNPN